MQTSNPPEFSNHIPEAVRRSSARADELAREAGYLPPESDAIVTEPVVDTTVETPLSDTPPVVAVPAEDWEQRYNSLRGKYDGEMATMRAQVGSLERVIAAMNAAPAPISPAPATTVPVVVPEADVSEYGLDLVAASRRWARAELQPVIDELVAKVERLSGGQQQLEAKSTQNSVAASLDARPSLAGRWRATNTDPGFITWLEQRDDFSGEKRLNLLRHAFDTGDSERTARFFEAYLAEHTAPLAPAATEPQTTPAAPAPAGNDRPTLESLASPGRAPGTGGGPSGAVADPRIWTNGEIAAFYRDRNAGRYVGREDEATRLEVDIIAAAREGRVRQK